MSDRHSYTVSPEWLAAELGSGDLKVVDGSWYLPNSGRDHHADFAAERIPGAVFFDQDDIVDPASELPHTVPPAEVFAEKVGALGISDTDRIVVYDGPGFFAAPRVWWLFRLFGAERVYLLDGGFDNWKAEGRPVETGAPAKPAPKRFAAKADLSVIATLDEMKRIVASGEAQVADARPAARFAGTVPEPRPGMRAGHMPGARNVPVTSLSENGKLRSPEALREIFDKSGVDLDRPVVTTCGSGVTAAAIAFALQSLGHADTRLYDGSWSEWSTRDDTPVVTGEA